MEKTASTRSKRPRNPHVFDGSRARPSSRGSDVRADEHGRLIEGIPGGLHRGDAIVAQQLSILRALKAIDTAHTELSTVRS